jgi:hypothetical protein
VLNAVGGVRGGGVDTSLSRRLTIQMRPALKPDWNCPVHCSDVRFGRLWTPRSSFTSDTLPEAVAAIESSRNDSRSDRPTTGLLHADPERQRVSLAPNSFGSGEFGSSSMSRLSVFMETFAGGVIVGAGRAALGSELREWRCRRPPEWRIVELAL